MSQRLRQTFAELRQDLVHEEGPRISTMRNYRYCVVVYSPKEEYPCRLEASRLAADLRDNGWVVKSISLQALLFRRLAKHGPAYLNRLIAREKSATARSPERGMNLLRQKLIPELEGPDGLAADVIAEIDAFVTQNPDQAERTLVLLGRAGALFPFFSASALLKHIDGRTHNVPVVMLYPGERRGATGLSFMGRIAPHTDYRPRIYSGPVG